MATGAPLGIVEYEVHGIARLEVDLRVGRVHIVLRNDAGDHVDRIHDIAFLVLAGSGLGVSSIGVVRSNLVLVFCKGLAALVLVDAVLVLERHRDVSEVVEYHRLDTVDIGLRDEDEALQLVREGNLNLLVLTFATIDVVESKGSVLLVPNCGSSTGGDVARLGLLARERILVIYEIEETVLGRIVVTTVLAILTVLAVLAGSTVLTLGGHVGILAVKEPVSILTDRNNSSGLTLGSSGAGITLVALVALVTLVTLLAFRAGCTILSGRNGIGATSVEGKSYRTVSAGVNIRENVASLDLVLKILQRAFNFRQTGIESVDIRLVILARHCHSCEAQYESSGEEQVLEFFVHNKKWFKKCE